MAIDFKNDVKPVMDIILQGFGAVVTVLPAPYNAIAQLIVTGLRYADDLIAKGVDPIDHIERIHAADPMLADTESTWASALKSKFGDPA